MPSMADAAEASNRNLDGLPSPAEDRAEARGEGVGLLGSLVGVVLVVGGVMTWLILKVSQFVMTLR